MSVEIEVFINFAQHWQVIPSVRYGRNAQVCVAAFDHFGTVSDCTRAPDHRCSGRCLNDLISTYPKIGFPCNAFARNGFQDSTNKSRRVQQRIGAPVKSRFRFYGMPTKRLNT